MNSTVTLDSKNIRNALKQANSIISETDPPDLDNLSPTIQCNVFIDPGKRRRTLVRNCEFHGYAHFGAAIQALANAGDPYYQIFTESIETKG